MSIFKGSCVALVTPFCEKGVDYGALEKLLDFQIEQGTDAILVCGTTGEPATMSEKERTSVIEFSVKHVNKRVPLIAGTGSNCTAHCVEQSVEAQKLGADALLIVTPYYNKCSQEGLYRHYMTVADAVELPIITYNVPGRTAVNVQPKTLARIAEHKNIAAMKEASGDISQISESIRLCGDKIDFYSGNDDQTLPVMAFGGKGVISVLANAIPDKIKKLTKLQLEGNTEEAAKLQLYLKPLNDVMFCDVNPIPVKAALGLMGICSGDVRLPLCEMSPENLAKLASTLQEYGII